VSAFWSAKILEIVMKLPFMISIKTQFHLSLLK
jgi:hypothetical protein